MTKRAPGALNYIDPTWGNASPDGRLYPFYFKYFANLVPDNEDRDENGLFDFTNGDDDAGSANKVN